MELTGDGGGKVPASARSLRGRNRVARMLINWFRLAARVPGVSMRPVEVNGGPGALYLDAQQRLIAVVALDIADGQINNKPRPGRRGRGAQRAPTTVKADAIDQRARA